MAKTKKKRVVVEKVEITGIADKGKSIGRTADGMVVFVDGVAPGDIVDVEVHKKKDGYLEGVPVHFHQYASERVEPFCAHYGVCGGCKWQHLAYDSQLKHKQLVVENAFRHLARVPVGEFQPIVAGIPNQYYRNKLEYTFSNKRWLSKEEMEAGVSKYDDVLGFHRPGAFDKVVNIEHCYLQADPSNELRNFIREKGIEMGLSFFDLYKKEGFLRGILIRRSSIGELMLIVSFFHENKDKRIAFLDAILERFPDMTSLHYCINPKENDFIMDLDIITYHGKGYIEDTLGEVRFRIGPRSFFQTNTKQAERLFDVVVDFAELKGDENVYDLYTGLGSIALYIAKYCRQVVGIEEIADAIRDAEDNAARNNIANCRFYAGDVRKILTPEFAAEHGRPDLLITDPPRAGMHPDVVKMLVQLEAPKLIYVSCNPATQARDMQVLGQKYEVLKVRPVDMFPHTHHIENVALLALR